MMMAPTGGLHGDDDGIRVEAAVQHHHHIISKSKSKFFCNLITFFIFPVFVSFHHKSHFNIFTTKAMIRNPNFQIRKRKWKTVLFLLRKRKRKSQQQQQQQQPYDHVKQHHDVVFEGNDSNWRLDDDIDDGDCCDADERDENPRNDVDERIIEGSEMENPSLGLDRVVGKDEEEDDDRSKSMVVVVSERKDGGDTPPDDDCCPICFENFSIACKTNCGHWFCANCILQFWTYRTVLQKCNCPICARPISKLTPEASLLLIHEVEVLEVLKNVQRYNRIFQGGFSGVIRKVFEVPNVFKRILRGLMDPDRFRGNYYAMRSFALLMSCIYNVSSFDFIPTGTLGVRRLFDLCAIALVVILCLVGVCHRLVLRRRVRRLAANQL